MKKLLCKTLPALALLAAGTQAQALDWTLLGDAFATGNSLTVTTAYNADSDAPFNLTGNPAVWIDTLELAAGLPFHALDLPDEPAYEGSLASTSVLVQAGDTLSFNYSYTTQETLFQDQAFVVINGALLTLGTRNTHPATGAIFSYVVPSSGTVTLAFGVVDTGDFNGVTRMSVSELTVTPVPEPATWLLMLAGAGLLARRQLRLR